MMGQKKKKLPIEISAEVQNYLELNFQLPADRTTDCCLNGHFLLLYANNGQAIKKTLEQVKKLFEVEATNMSVMNLVCKFKQLAVKFSMPDDQQHFKDLCKESFKASKNFNVRLPLKGPREYLALNFTFPIEGIVTSAISCKNGHALHLYYNETNRSTVYASREINKLFGLNSNKNHVAKIVFHTKNYIKSFHRLSTYQHFEIICYEPFNCTVVPKPSNTKEPSSPTHLLASTQLKDSAQLSTSVDPTFEASTEPTSATVSVSTYTGDDLPCSSRDSLTSREMQLKKRLSYLSQHYTSINEKYKSKKEELKSKLKDMPQKLKVLNQKVKRKSATIKALKKKIHELKKNKNRKKIQSLKVKRYTSDGQVKHLIKKNTNRVVITNSEKTNHLEEVNKMAPADG